MATYINGTTIGKNYAPVVDIGVIGQEGLNAKLEFWDNDAAYVRQNVHAFLVAPPPLMQYMEDYETRVKFLKSLIETRARQISGLANNIDLEFSSKDKGSNGNQKHSVVGGKIATSTPSFTWNENSNATISRFFEDLIRFVYFDPDLGGPGVKYSEKWLAAENPLPIVDVNQEMMVGFVEPNAELTMPVKAWLCAMQPQSTGASESSMTKGGTLESPDVNITFNASTSMYDTARTLAADYLAKISTASFTSESGLGFTNGLGIHSDLDHSADNGAEKTLNTTP